MWLAPPSFDVGQLLVVMMTHLALPQLRFAISYHWQTNAITPASLPPLALNGKFLEQSIPNLRHHGQSIYRDLPLVSSCRLLNTSMVT